MGGKPNENFSAAGRLGLTFGLGAWLGAPGYIAGGALGSVLFPPATPEPPDPYTALALNTAEEGAPVALHYGVNKIKGNWIYKGPLRKKKVEQGGKGGQKTVTGYKYWTWATLGLGKGTVDITRMWKNDDVQPAYGNAQIEIYRGTADQTVNPDWAARADDVVPLKRLAYTYLNNYYLGENNNQMPTISTEVHRFPWDSAMDSIPPYVANKVSEQTVGGNKILRDAYDNIHTFTRTEWKTYNASWELQKTVDLTNIALPIYEGTWDVCLTYSGGKTYVNMSYNDGYGTELYLIRFDAGKEKLETEKTETQKGQFRKYLIHDFVSIGVDNSRIRANSEYIFIATSYLGSAVDMFKIALNGQTVLAHYDFLSDFDIGAMGNFEVNEDFCFWMTNGGKTAIIDFNGVKKDVLNTSPDWAPGQIVALKGAPCLLGIELGIQTSPPNFDYDRIQYVMYDRDTGMFETVTQNELNIDETWWTDHGSSPFFGTKETMMCHEGPNGTFYLTGHDSVGNYYTMELVLDANPANIIYDLFKETKGFGMTLVDESELEGIGDTCFDNRIGMSFSLVRKQNVGAVVRDILGHIQAHPYQTDEGKFGFFMPKPSDSVIDTIEIEDVLSIKDDTTPDVGIISTSLKDIGLCPNRLNVTYENRLNWYKRNATFQLDDMLAQDLDGEVIEETLNYQMFSNPAVVSKMAWKAWKIGRFQNMLHVLVLNGRWLKIRHGQVYNLNFPDEGIVNKRCRVWSVQDAPPDTDAGVTVMWMMDDEFITSYEEIDYDPSISENTSVGPAEEVVPVVWEEDARYNNDVPHMGFTAIRSSDGTAYCDIHISLDAPDNFFYALRLTQFANVGDLTVDMDDDVRKIRVNTDDYSESTFATYTRVNQRNNLSYCLVGEVPDDLNATLENMEFVTYRGSVDVSGDLELRNVVRGKDYTQPKAHAIADETVVLHTGISYNKIEIPTEWMGKTIYIKFVPFNLRGDGFELDDVDTYEYTISNWTRKATHADRGQIEDSARGKLGSRTKTEDSDVKIVWQHTNRNDGIGKATLNVWEWNGFQMGDVDDYDIIVYESDGVTVKTEHLSIGLVDNYTYTNVQNTTDFGGVPSDDFWLGIRPVVTGRGPGREGFDIEKVHIERV